MSSGLPLSPLEPWIAAKIGAAGQPLARSSLEAHQLARLNDALRLVRDRSPFYRRRLAGTLPDLASLDDLRSLPFTTSEDVREQGLQCCAYRRMKSAAS
jgi:phenylacetate-CoA ligase